MKIEGKIVDIHNRSIFEGAVFIEGNKITDIIHCTTKNENYIIPGFIDAHVHIESSMLTPQQFAKTVIPHGTVAIVTDPHEIANVLGRKGVEWMKKDSSKSALKTYFSIPSCVPATSWDISGGEINAKDVAKMAASGEYIALSEMMNVPGVLNKEPEIMQKIAICQKYNLPIDGHAPEIKKEELKQYIQAGITTDHECVTLEDALLKISLGMRILIREGSAAQSYDVLKSLIKTNTQDVMFCTDDAHPDTLTELGHIDKQVRRAIADGFDIFDVLQITSLNPIKHYGLDVGLLRKGDKADFLIVKDLVNFELIATYIEGVDCLKQTSKKEQTSHFENNFNHDFIKLEELQKEVKEEIPVIGIIPNQLITKKETYTPAIATKNLEADLKNDILKIVYIDRYNNGIPQVAFCKGFELKEGAMASSVAHDSHNIIAIGCNDTAILQAINKLIESKGGLSVHYKNTTTLLPLPIAGIMSPKDVTEVVSIYKQLNVLLKEMGCTLKAPFMTLSFMSLLVIPEIKIGAGNLFSTKTFDWIN